MLYFNGLRHVPRRAYNPAYPSTNNLGTDWSEIEYPRPIWDNVSGEDITGNIKEDFELCPPGYHLPSDGYTDQVSYNGKYPNFKRVDGSNNYDCDYEGNAATPFDHKAQIEYSEWRQSMWLNPIEGDIGSWTGSLRLYPDRIVERYITSLTIQECG